MLPLTVSELDVGEETTSSKASGNKTDWSAITFLDVAKTKDGRYAQR